MAADVHLITGASGFIGGHLAQRLRGEGHPIRCLVRGSSDTRRLERLGAQLALGSLEDPGSLRRAAAGCARVVHCGAMVSDWGTVAEIERVNVAGTRRLLQAAAEAGVRRFVHVSTTDVYGYPGTAAVTETHPVGAFRNWYAQTKARAEAEIAAAARGGLDAVILRPATVWGPRSTEVVGQIARALRGGHMLLIDGGRRIAGLVYVENLVDAILLALRHDAASGEAFNVTDGLAVTWRQFTDGLAAGIGAARARLSIPYRPAIAIGAGLEHAYRGARRATGLTLPALLSRQAVHVMGIDQDFSNGKLRERLGWAPRVGYARAMDATVQWLREEQLAS